MSKSQIVLQDVSLTYGSGATAVSALSDISFEVATGELVAILGPSGCGKTTLLRLVAGILPCPAGTITVANQPVQAPHPSRTMIFQEHNLFPWKTVRQNVAFGLKAQGLGKEERWIQAQKYIDLVQLTGFENAYPHQLSGGMRQRVAIARALAVKPACVLMDEPFGALDAQLRSQLQDTLLGILAREQKTILFVTHDIEEAIYLSHRVVVLSSRPGRIRHIQPITLPHPRQPEMKLSSEFQALKATLWDVLKN